MIRLGFVTPVHERHDLTAVCLTQRLRMTKALREHGIDAASFVVGDDPVHREIALARSAAWIECDNQYLGRKFNAGYAAALDAGCTHAMAIGSDSWLDPTIFYDAEFGDHCLALVGLSSFRPDGLERLDMFVKYAAGFGVGMVYPTAALGREPCEFTKQRGCDSSVWRRCGNGRIPIKYLPLKRLSYLNFTSPEVQVTDYKALAFHRKDTIKVTGEVFDDLRALYPAELVDRVQGVYASRSIGNFIASRAATLETVAGVNAADYERPIDRFNRKRKIARARPRPYPGTKGQGARR